MRQFNFISSILLVSAFISCQPVFGAGTYIKGPALIEGFTTTATAAGTTTLTVASETKQIFTGSTTQTVVLPDATTLPLGRKFKIINKSSGDVTVNLNGGSLSGTVTAGTDAEFHLRAAGSAAGTWDVLTGGGGGGSGSVTGPATTVSGEIALYNGTDGTVLSRASGTGLAYLTSGVLSATSISSAAIGATANADGLSISSDRILTLQPASATFGGVLSAGAQSISGEKRFVDRVMIGSASAVSSDSAFEVSSTNRGSRPFPAVQISDVSSPTKGVMTYDPTINAPAYYDGTQWNALNTVSQASIIATAYQPGAANCGFSESSSSGENDFVTLGTAGSCASAWTVTGIASAVGATSHQITLTNMPPGIYEVILNGQTYVNGAGLCNFRLSDGTDTFGYGSVGQTNNNGSAQVQGTITYTDSGTRTFRLQAADAATSCHLDNGTAGRAIYWTFKRFPTGNEQLLSLNAMPTDTDMVSYTPTYSAGFGTVSGSSARWQRRGDKLRVEAFFTAGTVAGSVASVSIPAGLAIDVNKLNTNNTSGNPGQVVGAFSSVGSGLTGRMVTAPATSVSVVYFSAIFSSTGNLTPANGSAVAGTGGSVSFWFEVPIVGWTVPVAIMPVVRNSVTSNSSGAERIERVFFGGSGSTGCTSDPCEVKSQSGAWLTSVTRSGTGAYTLNIASGIFSATPTCTCNGGDITTSPGACNTAKFGNTATSYAFTLKTTTGGAIDDAINLICMGPR